jgi:hypothetical protein
MGSNDTTQDAERARSIAPQLPTRNFAFGRIFAVRPSLADRQLHTKYRTFFAIGSHVLGRCRPKPDRRLTVAKTATLSQLKHLLRSGRIAYRSISSSSRSSSRPVNPMIVPSLAPFDRRGENSRRRNARRIFVKARSSRGACRATTPQVHPARSSRIAKRYAHQAAVGSPRVGWADTPATAPSLSCTRASIS